MSCSVLVLKARLDVNLSVTTYDPVHITENSLVQVNLSHTSVPKK